MVDTATDDRDHGSLPVPRYSSDDEREPLSRLDVAPEQPHSIQRRLLSLPKEEFGFLPRELTLVVDASPGCGGITWPAATVLSRYLHHRYFSTTTPPATPFPFRSILELGSGTGAVGIALGILLEGRELGHDGPGPDGDTQAGGGGEDRFPPKVWVTDQDVLTDLMRENVLLNGVQNLVETAELSWGRPLPPTIPQKPDLILAADCVYFEPAFPLLVETMKDLSDEDTEILFCYKKRRKADKRFFSLLKKDFTFVEVRGMPLTFLPRRDAGTARECTLIGFQKFRYCPS